MAQAQPATCLLQSFPLEHTASLPLYSCHLRGYDFGFSRQCVTVIDLSSNVCS